MPESSLEFGKIYSGKKIDLMIEDSPDDTKKLDEGIYCRCSIFLSGTNTRIGNVSVSKINGEPKAGALQLNILSQYQGQGFEADACQMVMPLADDMGLEVLEMELDPSDTAEAQILDRLNQLRLDQNETTGQQESSAKTTRFLVSRNVTDEDRKYARIVDGLCAAAILFLVISIVLYLPILNPDVTATHTQVVIFSIVLTPCIPLFFRSQSLESYRDKMPPKRWVMIDLVATSVYILAVICYAIFGKA